MAGLTEETKWESEIYQIETTDPVMGGPNGIANMQARQLANRTKYLKGEVEKLNESMGDPGDDGAIAPRVKELEEIVGSREEGDNRTLAGRLSELETFKTDAAKDIENLQEDVGNVGEDGALAPRVKDLETTVDLIINPPEPPKPDAEIVGVCWNRASQSTALTRLTQETDPYELVTVDISTEPVAELTGTRSGSSPFDDLAVWSGMKMFNFTSAGVKGVGQDDPSFSLTSQDVMVYIPAFWYKVVNDAAGNKRYYYISSAEVEGFKKHPGSDMYIGRYETTNNNASKSGAAPTGSQTRGTMRSNARSKGSGWQLEDWAVRSALQLLYVVEFADWDCQAKIGRGNDDTSGKQNTGGTDSMAYHTGRPAGTDGTTAVQYRHVENPWGNMNEWVDGVNIQNGKFYISTNRDSYADDTSSGYTQFGETFTENKSGFINSLGYDANMDWAIGIPLDDGGAAGSWIPDGVSLTYDGNWRVLYVSGYYGVTEGHAGLFRFIGNYGSGNLITILGSRLSYKATA